MLRKSPSKPYTSKPSKNSAKPLVLITLTVVVLMIALFAITKYSSKTNSNPRVSFKELPSLVNQPVQGKDDAPVTLVEFGDYKCPSCKAWSETVYPKLKAEYIDTGKMKFSYINVLFHGKESELAAAAGEAVFAQDKAAFWSFHKALFEAQPKENHDGLWVTEEKLIEVAKTSVPSINLVKLKEDIQNQAAAAQVKTDSELVEKYKIAQTPTIMIDGVIVQNPFDLNEIKSLIDKGAGASK